VVDNCVVPFRQGRIKGGKGAFSPGGSFLGAVNFLYLRVKEKTYKLYDIMENSKLRNN